MNNHKSPFSKIFNFIKRILLSLSSGFDRLLSSRKYTLMLSLVLALLVYFSVQYTSNKNNEITDSLKLDDVKVEVIMPSNDYEISGVPQNVSAIVNGSISDLVSFRSTAHNARAVLDLTEYSPGTYRLNFSRRGIPNSLYAVFSPDGAEITISLKESRVFKLDTSLVNEFKVDQQYVISNPVLDVTEVEVKASKQKLDKIAKVVAMADVSGKTQSFETQAKVVAYDSEGKELDVEINPSTVNMSLSVSSPSRQVRLVVNPAGEIPNNKAIQSIELDQSVVNLYGPQDVLNKISSLPININAQTLTEDATITYTLIKPAGVNLMDIETVNVKVTLGDKTTKVIEKIPVVLENNTNNYTVTGDLITNVTLSGVASRLEEIDASDIKVYVDLANVKEGDQKLALNVIGTDSLVDYELSTNEITVNITKKGE